MLALVVDPSHASCVPRLDELESALDDLHRHGLLRVPDTILLGAQEGMLLACSNDYLALGAQRVSRETMPGASAGAGASRLIHGTRPEHLELELALAAWVDRPSALLFSSGYAANVGTLAALCDRNHLVISDRLNHASLVDGCRLSRATVAIVDHGDEDAIAYQLERAHNYRARWVVVESYYSMDGDTPNLARLRALCDQHDAHLYVDEAHALGVFGPAGAGLCRARNVVPDVLVGTLGKSLGASGAFVAGANSLRRWLWNRARSFVFSTGTSPLLARLILQNLRTVQTNTEARSRLQANGHALRDALVAGGLSLPPGNHGPIVPILIGDAARSVRIAARLLDQRIVVQAIRPPTVPPDTARLRITVTAAMAPSTVQHLAAAIVAAVAAEPP